MTEINSTEIEFTSYNLDESIVGKLFDNIDDISGLVVTSVS